MQIMDKTSFMKKYRSEHTEIWTYAVLEIIFDIVGGIIIIKNGKELFGSHFHSDEPKLLMLMVLGVLFWGVGAILLSLIKRIEANGNKEYENYLKSNSINQENDIQQNDNGIVNTNTWICPNCGRQNQNYVGTCGCGEVKPK